MYVQAQQDKVAAVEPVAIIGMAFRFPEKNESAHSFWEFVKSAQIAIRETPPERFEIGKYYSDDPDCSGRTYSRRAGYVDDPYLFDPEFFRISTAEALEMDPQQRWILQLCWSALENAGIVPSTLRGQRVGLFLTTGEVDYARRTVASGDLHRITHYGKLGTNRAVAVGRVAYTLGLQGPAIYVDSACSASLVAVHLAAQSLRCGDCDLAIAGGVNLILGPEETIGFARLRAMSTTDSCRTFDNAANGYIRGEGGAVVVLKRAQEATSAKDRIEALLVGSSVNNDGASNGLTAPNGAAQEAVIRQALAQAGAKPEDVIYVEAHGTGTRLGDPIELNALKNVYSTPARRDTLFLGALKAQIGHLEGTAGIAGLIKAILVLRHQHAPRQANFNTPTTRFRWEDALMEVSSGQQLPVAGRLVGISAFGISGTNAHALLAPPPTTQAVLQSDRMRVLTISARSPAALRNLAGAYLEVLGRPEINVRDICYTASVRREHWNHRLAVVGKSRDEIANTLSDFANGLPTGLWHAGHTLAKTKLVFLFPGQGCWQPGIGAGLYRDNPIFRSVMDDCFTRLADDVAVRVRKAILDEDKSHARHDPGQLAHFVLLYSLARTWIQLGVRPDAVIGHSLGEHVAAVIAGVMSLEDGLKIVEARGRLFETLRPPGAMLAVAADAETLAAALALGDSLFIAAINGPEQTVLSGTPAAVASAEEMLNHMGLRVTRLHTYDTPGHSQLLVPILAPFRAALAPICMSPPKIEFISTVTGKHAGDEIATADYWVNMVERPVRFHDALTEIAGEANTFLEVGPGTGLTNLARMAVGDWTRSISSLGDGPEGNNEPEQDGFAHACARLYCMGHPPKWERLYGSPPMPAEAPTYPFETRHIELPTLEERVVTEHATPARDVAPSIEPPQMQISPGIEAVMEDVVQTIRPVSNVALDDDTPLVELGFDSLALIEVRMQLNQRFGRVLPAGILAGGASLRNIATFYANSTATPVGITGPRKSVSPVQAGPQHLLLREGGCSNNHDLIVTLREGGGPVVALVHPVGGDVLCYRELANAWPRDAKIVCIQHPEVEQGSALYRPVIEMAELYRYALLDALGVQPDIIGGWSFGGVVAHEMVWQWEQEGRKSSGLVLIDSPLPDSVWIERAQPLFDSLDIANSEDPLDLILDHAEFQTLFDELHGLGRLRALANAEMSNRLLRIHAANALALARHAPRPICTPLRYALALRSGNAMNIEEALERINDLAIGSVTALGFDCDHFSIMRAPAVHGVTGFFGAAPAHLERIVVMAEAE